MNVYCNRLLMPHIMTGWAMIAVKRLENHTVSEDDAMSWSKRSVRCHAPASGGPEAFDVDVRVTACKLKVKQKVKQGRNHR